MVHGDDEETQYVSEYGVIGDGGGGDGCGDGGDGGDGGGGGGGGDGGGVDDDEHAGLLTI